MAIERTAKLITVPAGIDLRTHQYKVVSLNTSGAAILPLTAVTAIPFGILQNAPNTGEEAVIAPVLGGGESKAIANAALNPGVIVALEWVDDVGDSGKVKAAAATQFPVGQIIVGSGAEDDLCTVLLGNLSVV